MVVHGTVVSGGEQHEHATPLTKAPEKLDNRSGAVPSNQAERSRMMHMMNSSLDSIGMERQAPLLNQRGGFR